jgi:hypothetical protein
MVILFPRLMCLFRCFSPDLVIIVFAMVNKY